MTSRLVDWVRAALARRLLGVSADEILYTFEDVRRELRATRAELSGELAALRRDVDRLAGQPAQVDTGDRPDPDRDHPARPGRSGAGGDA